MAESKPVRTLLIEDNPGDAKLFEIQLNDVSHGGFELKHVDRLGAGMLWLEEHPDYNLVLLDLSLPDAQGLEGLARLHAQHPDLAIVVLTGLNDENIAVRAMRMGAQDYLVKGMYDSQLLLRALRYTLERKHAEIERTHLKQELARRERLAAIGQTVSSVMHYIKNVMTRMISSERLLDQMLTQTKNEKLLEIWPIMRRATDDLNAYIKGMLNFSRDHTVELEARNLNDIARQIHALCQHDAAQLGIELELILEPDMPDSMFDYHMINDAALNLVTNALEASAEMQQCAVKITTRYLGEEGNVMLIVEDNGPGIPPNVRERVFDPFFTTKGNKGNGLGLAMAHKSVVAHNGTLTLETRVGWTQFQIVLPVEPAALSTAV